MGFFRSLFGKVFGRGEAPKRPGFFSKERRAERKQARAEKKIQRDYERSQKKQEKMDKKIREQEEQQQKYKDEQKKREQQEHARSTFKKRYGFNDREYEGFIQFIGSVGEDMKDVYGSMNLVEAFRTGKSLGLDPKDMVQVVKATYSDTFSATQEDLIDDLYRNMEGYAQNVKEGAYV